MIRHVINCESGKTITFRVINPRMMVITPLDKLAEVRGDSNELIGLNYNNEAIVNRGEVLSLKNHKFKPASFKRVVAADNYLYGEGYYLYNTVLTKASTFVFPLLGHNKFKFHWDEYLMNLFLGSGDDVYDHIYLWYRYVPNKDMEEFENFIMSQPTYISHRDVDKYHVLYKMAIPDNFKDDFKHIIEGRYSKIDILTKVRILEFHNKAADSPLGQILYQAADRRKKLEKDLGIELDENAELFDSINLEEEIWKPEYAIPNTSRFKLREDGDLTQLL